MNRTIIKKIGILCMLCLSCVFVFTGCKKTGDVETPTVEIETIEITTESPTTKKQEKTTKETATKRPGRADKKTSEETKKDEDESKQAEAESESQTTSNQETTQAPQTTQTTQQNAQTNATNNTTNTENEIVTSGRDQTAVTHKHSYVSRVTKEATCTDEGIITYTCPDDGDSYTEFIPKKAHTFTKKIIQEATCGNSGEATWTCDICGTVDHNETIDPTGNHQWEPVYKTTSKTKYICDCGQSFDSLNNWQNHSNSQGSGHDNCSKRSYSVSTGEVDYYKCAVCGETN